MDKFVVQQLSQLGLAEYIDKFKENEIDEESYRRLEIEDLREILPGKVGPQRKIFSDVTELSKIATATASVAETDWYSTVSSWTVDASGHTVHNELPSRPASAGDDTNYHFEGHVILYIDNSNIFINTQKHAAKLQKFQHGIRSDKRCRIDVGKLVAKAMGGRSALVANLYGSEPPVLDTVWKSIREKNVAVMTHKKSSWTNREKQIDTSLVADAVEGIMKFGEMAGPNRALILFTGDKDMLTVIKKARRYDWKVEIWSYKAALSNEIEREARMSKNWIKIIYMDDFFKTCTFSLTKWKKAFIPVERSLVILYPETRIIGLNDVERDKFITEVVNSSSTILRMPTLAKFILHSFDYNGSQNNSGSVVTSNRFEKLAALAQSNQSRKCIPLVLVCIQRERSCSKEEIEAGGLNPNKTNAGGSANGPGPFYNFTKDVWSKKDSLRKSISKCVDVITYPQFRNNVVSDFPEIEAHLELEEFDLEALDDADDPDFLDFDYLQVVKKQQRKCQQYSEFCTHRFRCKHGTKCQYGHSDQEKEYFREHPFAKRYLYKTKLCTKALEKRCKYERKRYLCSYAHDFYECTCFICGETGCHWADECPDKTY